MDLATSTTSLVPRHAEVVLESLLPTEWVRKLEAEAQALPSWKTGEKACEDRMDILGFRISPFFE